MKTNRKSLSIVGRLAKLPSALFSAATLCAQSASFEWAQFVADAPSLVRYTTCDSSGNLVVGALDYNNYQPGNPVLPDTVVKLDTQGQVTWANKDLVWTSGAGIGTDRSVYVAGSLLRNGNLTLTPETQPDHFTELGIPIEGSGTAYIARLLPSGETKWVRFLGNSASVAARDVKVTASGDYYVAGLYAKAPIRIGDELLPAPTLSKGWNLFLARCTPEGQPKWVRVGQATGERGTFGGLTMDDSENVLMTFLGATYSFEGGTVKGKGAAIYSAEGKLLWAADPATPINYDMIAMDSAGHIFRARTQRLLPSPWPLWLEKTTRDGALIWQRKAEVNSSLGLALSMSIDAEGNCILAGQISAPSTTQEGQISFGSIKSVTASALDIFVVKYSAAGEVRWATQSVGLEPRWEGSPPPSISQTADPLIVAHLGGRVFVAANSQGAVQFGNTTLIGPGTGAGAQAMAAGIFDPDASRPTLNLQRDNSALKLSWPQTFSGFLLEATETLPTSVWTTVDRAPLLENGQNVVTMDASPGAKFFRLRKP